MIADILDADGDVLNTIMAEAPFLEEHHPGRWREVMPVESFSAVRAALLTAVDALAAEKMAAGYPHDFGAPYGVQILQNRDADDRTNWLSVAATANLMIAMGRGGDPCGALRTEANVNVPVTAAQAAGTLVAMQAHLGGFLARAWALKDRIRAATDADLDAIDITAGWPG